MRATGTTALVLLILARVIAAQQSMADLTKWFESDATAIMQDPAVQRIGAYSAGVNNVRLTECALTWSAEDASSVRVPLKSLDPQSIRLQTSKLLETRTIISLEMNMREQGEPATAVRGLAFMEMRRLSVLVRNQADGQRLLEATKRAIALCQQATDSERRP